MFTISILQNSLNLSNFTHTKEGLLGIMDFTMSTVVSALTVLLWIVTWGRLISSQPSSFIFLYDLFSSVGWLYSYDLPIMS